MDSSVLPGIIANAAAVRPRPLSVNGHRRTGGAGNHPGMYHLIGNEEPKDRFSTNLAGPASGRLSPTRCSIESRSLPWLRSH